MNSHIFAPVLIPTLCRHEHFMRCISSLSRCIHADKTDLFVALDFPYKESQRSGYDAICNFLQEIKGFKSVNIIKRTSNYGAFKNMTDARNQVFELYDRLIFSEDDNEFSPNFLDYINKGLCQFEKDDRVYAICGFAYMTIDKFGFSGGYGMSHRFCASGYGITRDKYQTYFAEFIDVLTLRNILQNIRESWKIFQFDPFRLSTLLVHVDKGMKFPDFDISANLIIRDMYCVFPNLSLVRNHGYDGSGVNSYDEKEDDFMCFSTQEIDDRKEFFFGESPLQNEIDSFESHVLKRYKGGLFHNSWVLFRYLVYRLFGKVLYLGDGCHEALEFLLRKVKKV